MPVEYRNGLVLFLRHGMICWVKGISETEFYQKQETTRSSRLPKSIMLNQNNKVTKIFAAMTLHTQDKKERAT